MSVKTVDNIMRFYKLTATSMDNAIGKMAKDVKQIASIRVPYLSGDLQASIKPVKKAMMHHRVEVGGGGINYAHYQEAGQRKDGSHRVRKYSTPGTGKHFLKDAGESVEKNVINYIKQAVIKKV